MSRRADIALLAPLATSLYLSDGQRPTGGAEFQSVQLARALAGAGLSVAHVVFDAPGLPAERDGVSVAALPPREPPPGLVRSSAQLVQVLARLAPQVVIQRSAGFDTGIAAGFARATGRRFVFSSSSSVDFTLDTLGNRKTRMAYRTGLRLADQIVVQTDEQSELVARLHGREARLIRSFCVTAATPELTRSRDFFLWIGSLMNYKQPLKYLELAARVPEARFAMVATSRGARSDALSTMVGERAAALPNVELLDARPREALLELYEHAVAVVNTSDFEGFPNTFLEGWACGAPALSLSVDPDGVIARHRLGAVGAGSLDTFAEHASSLWASRSNSVELRDRCREYVELHHAPAAVGAAWVELVRELL